MKLSRMVETPSVVRWKGDLVHRAKAHPALVDTIERHVVCEGERQTSYPREDGSPPTCLFCVGAP